MEDEQEFVRGLSNVAIFSDLE